jgi:hypothetical protein
LDVGCGPGDSYAETEGNSYSANQKEESMISTKAILISLGACSEAVKWAGRKTPKRAWETCKRGDWLLWFAAKVGVDRKLVVLAACGCARTALNRVPKGEERPRIAIETAEAWTRGEATLEQVTHSAAYAASASAADAAYAYAAYAAYAAAYAAASRTRMAAWHNDRAGLAKIVRKIIPFSAIEKATKERAK